MAYRDSAWPSAGSATQTIACAKLEKIPSMAPQSPGVKFKSLHLAEKVVMAMDFPDSPWPGATWVTHSQTHCDSQ
jgi:hypothetical protein